MKSRFEYCPLLILTVLCLAQSGRASEFRLYHSPDEGQTWTRSDQGLPPDKRINSLHAIGPAYFAATDAGIFISTNSPQSWNKAPALPNNARPLTFTSLHSNLYLGTENHGAYVSRNNAQSWQPLANGLGQKTIRYLAILNGQVTAATDRDGLFAFKPQTQSWTNASHGLPTNSQVLELADVRGTAFAGLYSQGLYRRTSPDQPWQKTGDKNPLVLASLGSTLAIGLNPGGIYTTDDFGKTFRFWTTPSQFETLLAPSLPPDAPIWAMAATQTRLIAGAAGGIYISANHGITWTSANVAPDQTAIAFHTSPRQILAATTTHQARK